MKDKGEEGRREVVKKIKERQGRELKGQKRDGTSKWS